MTSSSDTAQPVAFCLHYLGGSAREWPSVIERFGSAVRCVALDLPGFGDAANEGPETVGAMAGRIADVVRAQSPERWYIFGHSMGAKIALALARRAEDGAAGLQGLRGLVLLAGSPPSPEPMAEAKRDKMISWIHADEATRQAGARDFVADNVGRPLDSASETIAVNDVLRANPAAWMAWLTNGSRQDWCSAINVLHTPALVLSGTADGDLGPAAQTALMMPHLAFGRHISLEGAGHLLPIEQPDAVVAHVLAWMNEDHVSPPSKAQIAEGYQILIASDRVNARLRKALEDRASCDDPAYRPTLLDPVELAILRAACARVLPDLNMDLGARIETRLTRNAGDGWRYAELPSDGQAYRLALRTLDSAARKTYATPFVALAIANQDILLQAMADGQLDGGMDSFDQNQMRLWFEDLRSDAVQISLAHPAVLARLGYSGIGAGGDEAASLTGFKRLGIGEREDWEPVGEHA